MSEFKFACPVCGQHMMCDTSHGGSVMECPTCFQKIVAPQAPAPDAKFILIGTKLTEKKITASGVEAPAAAAAEKKFPMALVAGLVLGVAAIAAAIVFHDKLFKVTLPSMPTNAPVVATKLPPPKQVLVAPTASDTNWMLTLDTNAIPDQPVAGRIHGQDFIMERASFQNGTLMLRQGTKGPVEFGALINFAGAQPESVSDKIINITTDAALAARVTLCWKDNNEIMRGTFTNGYALRLEFGMLTNNRLPGKIYLCTSDNARSYLMGSFNADARKPKPKAPPKK